MQDTINSGLLQIHNKLAGNWSRHTAQMRVNSNNEVSIYFHRLICEQCELPEADMYYFGAQRTLSVDERFTYQFQINNGGEHESNSRVSSRYL